MMSVDRIAFQAGPIRIGLHSRPVRNGSDCITDRSVSDSKAVQYLFLITRRIGWHIQGTKPCVDKLISNQRFLLKKLFDMI